MDNVLTADASVGIVTTGSGDDVIKLSGGQDSVYAYFSSETAKDGSWSSSYIWTDVRDWGKSNVKAGSGDDIITLTGTIESKAYNYGSYSGYRGEGYGYGHIYGEDGNDTIDASNTTVVRDLNGGAGDDIISSGAGLDIVTGGTGDDVFNAGTAAAPAVDVRDDPGLSATAAETGCCPSDGMPPVPAASGY